MKLLNYFRFHPIVNGPGTRQYQNEKVTNGQQYLEKELKASLGKTHMWMFRV